MSWACSTGYCGKCPQCKDFKKNHPKVLKQIEHDAAVIFIKASILAVFIWLALYFAMWRYM